MLNKLLIAGIAGAAFVAIGASTASAFAQSNGNGPADCADINTVAQIKAAGSCQISDKIFSDFTFSDTIPDTWNWSVSQEFPASGDFFVVRLSADNSIQTQNTTFSYSYTIEIDPDTGNGNQFKFVGLTQDAASIGQQVDSTKTFQYFDEDGNAVGGDNVLSVSGTDTDNVNVALNPAIKKITVQDEIVSGANGSFNSLSNEFQQVKRTIETPVPASLALFGFGLVALGYRLRRKA